MKRPHWFSACRGFIVPFSRDSEIAALDFSHFGFPEYMIPCLLHRLLLSSNGDSLVIRCSSRLLSYYARRLAPVFVGSLSYLLLHVPLCITYAPWVEPRSMIPRISQAYLIFARR